MDRTLHDGDAALGRLVPDARRLVGLLAEPKRRRVIAAMILGASNLEDIGLETGLNPREVVAALDRIEKAGLGERAENGRFILLESSFGLAARAEDPAGPTSAFPDEPVDVQVILDRVMCDGRLLRMPRKRSQRLVVLDHVAQRFEPGERYTERQVNSMLVAVDTDTATLRRYLVDEAILDRADGFYWRIGGTFPTE